MTKRDKKVEPGRDQHELTGLEIAIIGMSGRFPGANNLHEFWDNLKNGVHSIRFFTEEELLEKSSIDPEMIKKPNYVRAKGIIENAEYFDAFFFGYSPLEAEVLDPQVRIFSEICWEALEDAGCDPSTYNGLIGVYAGASGSRSWEILTVLTRKGDALGQFTADILSDKDYLSSRISHKLDLKGPSVTLFTACSTGLAAVDLACRGLLTGQCDAALAGGVSVLSEYASAGGYIYNEGMICSSDGYVRAFDAKAGGTVFSNGAGAVLLKRLDSAIADNDSIYAVIKGFAVDNDGGNKSSFTAPAVPGQVKVTQDALYMSEIEPGSITYVETHGTATEIGDPIEIDALKMAFQTEKKQYCAIGSVKTNIGHLDVASGIAGLIKVLLMLKYRQIPPILHYEKPNPSIDFENSPFFVNTQLREWKSNGYPLRAGVSSFGVGGVNAHVVLEAWPGIKGSREGPGGTTFKNEGREEKDYQLILLSARTGDALEKMTETLANYLTQNPGSDLADIAYTLKVGRKAFEHRKMLVCKDAPGAVSILQSSLVPETGGGGAAQTHYTKDGKRAVFMFPGQGSQYVDMARDLYEKEPLFRLEIDHCFEILKPITGHDFKKILYPSFEENRSNGSYRTNIIDQTEITQPVIFVIEYALARLLMAWGIKPHAMIGHDIGEYTAACLSGVFSLADALTVVAWHGKLMRHMPGGSMLSVSSMMDPILKTLEMKVAQVQRNQPRIPFISNVTGTWICNRDAVDPSYWARHLGGTVRFNDGLTELLKEKNSLFIEVGPGRTLSTFIQQHPGEPSEHTAVNLLRPPDEKIDDRYYLTAKIGQIWLYGVPVDWRAYYGEEKRYRLHLPTYPFQRQRYWIEGNPAAMIREGLQRISVPGKKSDIADWFYIPSWKPTLVHFDEDEAKEGKVLLLLNSENDFCNRFKEKFLHRGYEIIVVRTGAEFSNPGAGEFTVNPSRPGDYQALFQALREIGRPLRRIVHTWTITTVSTGSTPAGTRPVQDDEEREMQYLGFYSLLYIAQAIKKQNFQSFSNDFKIIAVSTHMQAVAGEEIVCTGKATLLSPLKVIPQELSDIRCRSIDIVVPEPPQGSKEEEKLIVQLLKEIMSDSTETVVAYRYNRRWIQSFEAVKPGENGQLESLLREKGVYLITGGLGGIGLVLAEYLAGSVAAKMILSGRTAFPGRNDWENWLNAHDMQDPVSRKIRKLQEIEEKGGQVMVCSVDIADVERMKEVIGRAEERFGQLNGVIHAAGILGKKSNLCAVEDMSETEVEEQFRPKVNGLKALAEILKDKKIDFCLLTSSISSVLGGLGYAAYAAANIYMDAFVKEYNRKHGGGWVSVNWDAWELGEKEIPNIPREESRAELIITPPEGQEVFRRIIALGALGRENQVIISTGDLQSRIDRWIDFKYLQAGEFSVKTNIVQHSRPEIATPYSAPQSPIEQKLAQIWQELLGIDQVGGNDDFFELGGDSLKVTLLVAKIKQVFNISITVREIFNSPRVRELVRYLEKPAEKETMFAPIEAVEHKEYYPVSTMQKRMYILNGMEGVGTAYNLPVVMLFRGELDMRRVKASAKALIHRHESLRTSFHMLAGEIVQVVHKTDESEVYIEYVACEGNKGQGAVDELVRGFIRPFDLTKAPLLRARFIKLAERKHLVVFDIHHIVSDGTSWSIITRDFEALYNGKKLAELNIQYKDFSQWQGRAAVMEVIRQQEAYWLRMFAGEIPLLNLPTDYPRAAFQSFDGSRVGFELSSIDADKVKQFALEQGVTLFMVLLALYNVLLYRLTGQEDIVIGTPIAGRRHAELEGLVGVFVNTLPMRNYPLAEKTFDIFLAEHKENTLEAFDNQEYPFENLVEKVAVARDISRNPLFDVMFVLQGFAGIPMMAVHGIDNNPEGLQITPREFDFQTTKFDLTLNVEEREEKLLCTFVYSSKSFKRETIERFISYFLNAIKSVQEDRGRRISDIEIMTEEERNRVLYEFNNTAVEYSTEKTIPQLFANQVERTPDYIALVGADLCVCPVSLTYRQLDEQADRLAEVLIEKGVQADTIVGIIAEPSIESIIGILGILKSGGAYLPIAPDLPQERIDYMLKDSGARIMIGRAEERKSGRAEFVFSCFFHASTLPRFHASNSSNLAYIIYTSGSTGRPKGVMVEHRNVINLVYGLRERIYSKCNRTLKFALVAPFIFDASVKQIFGALLLGFGLNIVPRDTRYDGEKLFEYYQEYAIDISDGTPTHLRLLLECQGGKTRQSNIKHFLIGGEPLTWNLIEKLFAHFKTGSFKITNVYGPTECCVDSTTYEISKENIGNYTSLPIGIPMPNQQVYIVGKGDSLQPLGVAGELYIGGNSVSRGYLNKPELTSEKFIDFHPSSFIFHHSILYRTGDLVRWLPEGNIEFLGRADQQVKIRGYRIELGEIENRLLGHKDIKEAAVVDRQIADGDKYLCAYIVWREKGNKSNQVELREFLLEKLPDYMAPSYFVEIEKIPLTPNGKLDRKLLPSPELKAAEKYTPPRNSIEKQSVEIWSDILGRKSKQMGIDDNFFHCGGHSLKAIILISRLHKAFHINIPLVEIFKRPTIRSLSEYIARSERQIYAAVEPAEAKEYYVLSSAQNRLYILQRMNETSTSYNMPFASVLEGQLDKNKLEGTFIHLIKRHESLRTSFEMINEEPVQRIHDEVEFKIEILGGRDLGAGVSRGTPLSSSDIIINFIRPFDLSRAPLLRVGLAELEKEKHILIVDMHHIIADGISRRIFAEEFMLLYDGQELPGLKLQYKDFAEWQSRGKNKELLVKQESYWKKEFGDHIPILDLPTDYTRPAVQSFEGDRITFEAGGEDVRALKTMAFEEGTTLYMVLLSMYYIFLSKLSNQEDIVVGTPTVGRRHVDLERIIGMFVNTLALRNGLSGEKTYKEFLREIKERALEAFENQEYQFEDLVEKFTVARDMSRNPFFDVMFVLQNISESELANPKKETKSEKLDLKACEYDLKSAKFDLTLEAYEQGGQLYFDFEYCTRLFKEESILRFLNYFKAIVSSVLSGPTKKIMEIDILSEEEKRQLLFDFNDCSAAYPVDETVPELFAAQVEKTPDHIALVGADSRFCPISLTYNQLNEQSDGLAGLLQEKGIQADNIIGLMLEPSVEMITGILGIWKAGGAYLPIDPYSPPERIDYILKDSGAKLLVTTNNLEGEKVRRWEGEKVLLEFIIHSSNHISFHHSSFIIHHSNHLAYIIYTSGTTGKPKGVLVEHRNVTAYLYAFFKEFDITTADTSIQLASFAFDAFIEEVFPVLFRGGKLVIPAPSEMTDIHALAGLIQRHHVNFIDCTPLLLNEFDKLGIFTPTDRRTNYIFISGGDVLKIEHVANLLKVGKVYNTYGPTESTICAAYYHYAGGDLASIPIGKPIANYKIFILDKYRNLAPIGVAGELCVSGPGVTRGYLNNPELTVHRFTKSRSYKSHKTNIFYKTGDLARRLVDGNVEFLGRIDQQVKIRGFRIELGEIESELLKHDLVKEVVVIDRESETGEKYLCGYVIPKEKFELLVLMEFLAKDLPDYMIPSYFVEIESIPLNPNGKCDRRALPEPRITQVENYAAPGNEIEEKIVVIWSEVLGIEKSKISIDADFFSLGGHSLKVMVMVAKIHKTFSLKLQLIQVFKAPTIRSLASLIEVMGWVNTMDNAEFTGDKDVRQEREIVML